MRKFVLCLVMVLTFASPAAACIGARAASMGYANVAGVNDATAAYWNPSLIPFLEPQVSFDTFCIVLPVPGWEPVLHYTSQSVITGSFGIVHNTNQTREYYMISYAHKLSDTLSLSAGISLDFRYNRYQGYGLVLSGTYRNDWLTLAVLAQDTNIRPSVAIGTDHILVCAEIYDAFDEYFVRHLRIGAELKYKWITAKVGYNGRDDGFNETEGYSIGLGIALNSFVIDLARFKDDTYGASFTYRF